MLLNFEAQLDLFFGSHRVHAKSELWGIFQPPLGGLRSE